MAEKYDVVVSQSELGEVARITDLTQDAARLTLNDFHTYVQNTGDIVDDDFDFAFIEAKEISC